jgi:hypothetical protein
VSHVGRPTSPARMTLPFLGNPRISWSGGECLGNVSLKSNLAVPQRSGKRLLSLSVFGWLPDGGARGCTEAGVRKASREETAGRG